MKIKTFEKKLLEIQKNSDEFISKSGNLAGAQIYRIEAEIDLILEILKNNLDKQ